MNMWTRLGVEVALAEFDTDVAQQFGLDIVLDHLRHRLAFQLVAKILDRLHDGTIIGVLADLADIQPIDLDDVDIEVAQILQGCRAGAEIVDADTVPRGAEALDDLADL